MSLIRQRFGQRARLDLSATDTGKVPVDDHHYAQRLVHEFSNTEYFGITRKYEGCLAGITTHAFTFSKFLSSHSRKISWASFCHALSCNSWFASGITLISVWFPAGRAARWRSSTMSLNSNQRLSFPL